MFQFTGTASFHVNLYSWQIDRLQASLRKMKQASENVTDLAGDIYEKAYAREDWRSCTEMSKPIAQLGQLCGELERQCEDLRKALHDIHVSGPMIIHTGPLVPPPPPDDTDMRSAATSWEAPAASSGSKGNKGSKRKRFL